MANQTQVKTGINMSTFAEDFAYLDALPARIRAELTSFCYNMDAKMVYDHYQSLSMWDRDPEYYVAAYMRPILAQQMQANSYTGLERYGAYKIVPNLHGKPRHQGRIFGVRVGKPRRRAGIFQPIPTGRGTWIDYGC